MAAMAPAADRRRAVSAGLVAVAALVGAAVPSVWTAGHAFAVVPAPSASPSARTVAGTGRAGFGGDGGPAREARLDAPSAVATDRSGDLFVADTGNCRVREVVARGGSAFGRPARPGAVVTVAGGPCRDPADPPPAALAIDQAGDLFVAYPTADRVAVLAARSGTVLGTAVTAGHLFDVAGTGVAGYSGDGGPAARAELDYPSGLATDGAGDLFVSDTADCRVRMVAASPSASPLAGDQPVVAGRILDVAGDGVCGSSGDGGPAGASELWDPGALAVDSSGDLLVADQGNRTVRALAPRATVVFGTPVGAGDLATVAGEGSYGPYLSDGLPADGQTGELNFPAGLALDADGNLLVADGESHVVRAVVGPSGRLDGRSATPGSMVTVAGATSTDAGHTTTSWVRTTMRDPTGIVVTRSGAVVFADRDGEVVRELPAAG